VVGYYLPSLTGLNLGAALIPLSFVMRGLNLGAALIPLSFVLRGLNLGAALLSGLTSQPFKLDTCGVIQEPARVPSTAPGAVPHPCPCGPEGATDNGSGRRHGLHPRC